MSNSLLALATDLRGIRWNASRNLSMLSSDTRGQTGILPLHKHPVSTNFRYHLVTLFLCGASFLNRARNSRCTVITDLDTSKQNTASLHLVRRHLGNRPRGPAISMRREKLVAHEKLGEVPLLTCLLCPSVVRNKCLLTSETAPLFCVCPVYCYVILYSPQTIVTHVNLFIKVFYIHLPLPCMLHYPLYYLLFVLMSIYYQQHIALKNNLCSST
jgi:hypothetical protein